MAEVAAPIFFFSIWGFVSFCRWLKRFVDKLRGKETERKNKTGITLTRAELEKVMIERAEKGDKTAEEWLKAHGYEFAGGEK